MEDPTLDPEAAAQIVSALDSLIGNNGGRANNGALDKLEQDALVPALLRFSWAIESLSEAEAADAGLDLTVTKSFLALAAKSVAVGAVNEALALATSNGDLRKIEQAEANLAEADQLLQSLDFAGAIDKQIEAVQLLQGILASSKNFHTPAFGCASRPGNGRKGAIAGDVVLVLMVFSVISRRRRVTT